MRSTNSIKNAVVAILSNIIIILIGFIAQRIFVEVLGNEYLGINGLFSNILSMLAIVELGFGSAIVYNFYKPVADGDKEKIKALLDFYKKTYRIIATVIFILGLFIIPFLGKIVGEVSIKENLNFIFILYLLDIVCSYLLTYKRSILYADQKTYIINIVHLGYLIVMNVLQIVFLLLTHNFILYLLIKIFCRIIENVIITIISNKKYPYIKEKATQDVDVETKKDILKKVKGLMFHNIGGFIVKGTDNIIISITPGLGIISVGLYSNYYMVLTAVTNLFSQLFNSLTASVGNLLIEKNHDKSYKVYRNMLMLNSWIFAFASASILCMIQPFVSIWLGKEYVLPFIVLLTLVINFYIVGMRNTYSTFKTAAGVFHEDRFVPLIEALLNLVFSLIFARVMGLAGVFIGTIISSTALFCFSYPKYVYKPLFKKSYKQYIKENITYTILAFVAVSTTFLVVTQFKFNNNFVQLIVNAVICLIIPNLIYYVVFRKREEFMYYKNLLKNIVNKFKERRV
jgi:putative membrane protein